MPQSSVMPFNTMEHDMYTIKNGYKDEEGTPGIACLGMWEKQKNAWNYLTALSYAVKYHGHRPDLRHQLRYLYVAEVTS